MKSLFWLHRQTKCHADHSEVEKSSKHSLKSVAAPLPEVLKRIRSEVGSAHNSLKQTKRSDLENLK